MVSSLINSLAGSLRMLRLTPFDTSTAEGRSNERERRIAWTSLSAAAAKAISALAMFVSVPISLSYLGAERFGLWMAVAASVLLLSFADFGIANGLTTAVAHAKGEDDDARIGGVISNGMLMLFGVALALTGVAWFTVPMVRWDALFNVTSPLAQAESAPLVAALLACFIINLPFAATQKIQLGLQRGYLANAWEIFGSLGGLIALVLTTRAGAGLPAVAVAMTAVPIVARAANTVAFFGYLAVQWRPKLSRIETTLVYQLLRVGSLYFVLQVALLVGMQSDNLIIARFLGAEAVATYDIALKLAALPSIVISFVVLAQWPAYGEAWKRGDRVWIQRTFTNTLRSSLGIALLFALALGLLGGPFITLWAGPEVTPPRSLLWLMALWTILAVAGGVIAALLNGLHVVRFQAINSALMAAANIALSIFLVSRIGVIGAILGTITAYVACTLIPCWFYIRRLLYASPAGSHRGEQ